MLECSKASGPETQSEGWSWPQQAITCSLQGDKFFFRARLIGAAKCVLYLSWLFLLLLDFEGKSEKTTHAFFKPTCTHTHHNHNTWSQPCPTHTRTQPRPYHQQCRTHSEARHVFPHPFVWVSGVASRPRRRPPCPPSARRQDAGVRHRR